ncbi:MAG: hypothetical protein K6D59_06990 [Bacteroidales bacterium]|nr:hypothetical protein [Bacteroidales bacterium]
MSNSELYMANEDIMAISYYGKEIGWESIAGLSFHRILYLAKVLYVFRHRGSASLFGYYHFTAIINGPYSEQVNKALAFLSSSDKLIEDGEMFIFNSDKALLDNFPGQKLAWIRFVLLLLGKYGEDKIFGFIINDPAYDNAVKTNRNAELDVSSESLTVRVLERFKLGFEETLDKGVSLSDEQYIDLYFEYLFGRIIKGS